MEQKDRIRYLSPDEHIQYLTLKEAAVLADYTPDYIGQLIRAGKIEGFQVYTNVSWVTTEKAVKTYLALKGRVAEKGQESYGFRANPHRYVRGALYVVIGCLVCLLVILLYIVSVGIDRAVTDATLEEFDARISE